MKCWICYCQIMTLFGMDSGGSGSLWHLTVHHCRCTVHTTPFFSPLSLTQPEQPESVFLAPTALAPVCYHWHYSAGAGGSESPAKEALYIHGMYWYHLGHEVFDDPVQWSMACNFLSIVEVLLYSVYLVVGLELQSISSPFEIIPLCCFLMRELLSKLQVWEFMGVVR